jgi:hypothetical protein
MAENEREIAGPGVQSLAGSRAEPRPKKRKEEGNNPLARVWAGVRPSEKRAREARKIFAEGAVIRRRSEAMADIPAGRLGAAQRIWSPADCLSAEAGVRRRVGGDSA